MGVAQAHQLDEEILHCRKMHAEEFHRIESLWRASNYLSVAQLYLKENFLLNESLKPSHIKEHRVGHWGTVPGINFIYAHLNRFIRQHDLDLLLVTGPTHGAAANLANLYLEGTLEEFYPELTRDSKGLSRFIHHFSHPEGFPPYLSPLIPGTIYTGKELGHALATAYGAVLDQPHLFVACIIGDGEAETGPTATAWHSPKFIDPAESGAVLPILHVNGYKSSNPSIYGTMSDEELLSLFVGYGYRPYIIDHKDLHAAFYLALDKGLKEILAIQHAARTGSPKQQPLWPLFILRSPKGWTGIKEIEGIPIEGSFRSHQIPLQDLKSNPKSLVFLEQWLRSYHPEELFEKEGRPRKEILDACPQQTRRMGCNPHVTRSTAKSLTLPSIRDFAQDLPTKSASKVNSLSTLGLYLKQVISSNPFSFRIFSADELESNQLGNLFETTHRNYQWPTKPFDRYISRSGGRITEMLSQHCCQAWLQGYLATRRHGLFPCNERFLPLISTMACQFVNFIKEYSFSPVSSLNYLETSDLWNHESDSLGPLFIDTLLQMRSSAIRIFLPPDANCLIHTTHQCLESTNRLHVIVASKQEFPQWLSREEAMEHCQKGASIWKWASIDEGKNPDVILAGIGDVPHFEVMAAAHILRHKLPELRIRVVNVCDLSILSKQATNADLFSSLFPPDRPVIFNFHGYPSTLYSLLHEREGFHRFTINGYRGERSASTPFELLVRNKISRYHLVEQALRLASPFPPKIAAKAAQFATDYSSILQVQKDYIRKNQKDPEEILSWKWTG